LCLGFGLCLCLCFGLVAVGDGAGWVGDADGLVVDGDGAGWVDGGVLDGGVLDGGVLDGGVLDGGVLDGGVLDGGVLDGGGLDGGGLDGGGLGDGGGRLGQLGLLIVSSSRVTAPLRASARPVMVTACCTVIELRARMVPTKVDDVFRVAELPTCQKTLQALAPLTRTTELPTSAVSVEAGAWKIQTALGSPPASRVSAPSTSSDDVAS
jgi:hypothetical protein